MIVGPTSAKTSNYQVLSTAMTAIGKKLGYYPVHLHILNPKAVTMG